MLDDNLGRLIRFMQIGGDQPSLGSLVAFKVDFEKRWALLSPETRALLDAKYGEGLRSKELAEQRGRGETGAQIDHKLTAAKRTARPLFEDLLAALP